MIRFHLGVATALFFVDVFVFDQGALLLLAALGAVLGIVIRSYRAKTWRQVLARAAVYVVGLIAVIGARKANNQIADARFAQVITAVEQYHLRNGKWPVHLEDAISPVPRAKYTLLDSKFRYDVFENTAVLEYVELPPFGRVYYNFDQKRRGTLD